MSKEGVNALDLYGEPATSEDFNRSIALIEMNFGLQVQDEKTAMLFDLIKEDGWSKKRLDATTKWFLKNKKFPSWTIADWFEFGIKLYPPSWYMDQIAKGIKHEEMECYKVNDQLLWKLKDGNELPFEKG